MCWRLLPSDAMYLHLLRIVVEAMLLSQEADVHEDSLSQFLELAVAAILDVVWWGGSYSSDFHDR